MHRHLLAVPFVLALAAPEAAADVNRCADADADVDWRGTDFVELGGDTGWFPSGSPGQLRLVAKVQGHTAVSAGYTVKGCWQDAMKASLAGRPGSGFLDVAYGAELALYGRVHVSVFGKSFDWEGQIPIPWVPDDLMIAGTSDFDPALETTTRASVSDSTSPVTVFTTNVLGNFIPGVSGGMYVTVRGSMTSSYRASTTKLSGTAVDAASDQVTIPRPGTGFHSTLPVPVEVQGTVRYAPRLTFAGGLDVRFLGIQVVNWEVGTVTMGLPALDRQLQLTGAAAALQLPELDGIGEGARMDFSAASTQTLRVKNTGARALELQPVSLPAGVTMTPLTVAAGAEAELTVTVADGALANGSATLDIATNDPDRGTLAIALSYTGGTDPGMEPEVAVDEGGCSAGGGAHGLGIAFVLVALGVRRRRRG